MSLHEDLEKYIENIYYFKKIWTKKCSQYNIEAQPSVLPAVKRIIVLGDIHGDWDMTMKALRVAKLIDNNGTWIGGETVVVQVGDQIDRCRYTGIPCNEKDATNPDEGNDWKILQYFTKLHKQALKVGGAVYSLIGNHELMNVKGDFRYVSYEGLREFDNYKYINKHGEEIDYYLNHKGEKVKFKNGEDARRWAFSPGNPISDFLACTRQMALIIGSNLFVHAGIVPVIAKKYNVKKLNQLMSLYLFNLLKEPSTYNDIFNSSDYSPLWNREFGNIGKQKYDKNLQNKIDDKLICNKLLLPLKKIYKVDKIFVGHTPLLDNGIGSVCDGKVWLTDYGLSKAFDKFDKDISTDSESYHRSSYRQAQVLEILDNGREINILQ
jgi:hypothetical protein